MPRKKCTLPALVQNEIRRAIALKCLDCLHVEQKMKKKLFEQRMFQLYRGYETKDFVSNMKQCVDREGAFEQLFESKDQNVVVEKTLGKVMT